MKRFLWIFLFVVILQSNCLGLKLILSSDKTILDINETIILNVLVKQTEKETSPWWSLGIAGLDNFEQVAQTQSSNYRNINWVPSFEQNISLHLKAKKTGIFQIWPATVISSWENFTSNILNITVTWTQLFVWNTTKNMINMAKNIPTKKQNIPSLDWDSTKNISSHANTEERKQWDWGIFSTLIVILLCVVILFLSKKKKNKSNLETYLIWSFTLPSEWQNNFWERCYILTHQAIWYAIKLNTESLTFNEIQSHKKFQEKLTSIQKKIFIETFRILSQVKYSHSLWKKTTILKLLKEIKKNLQL